MVPVRLMRRVLVLLVAATAACGPIEYVNQVTRTAATVRLYQQSRRTRERVVPTLAQVAGWGGSGM